MSKLSYLKLEPFKTYNNKHKLTSEQRFWKKYQNNLIHTYPTTITTISANRNTQNLVLYAEARSLRIYDTDKQAILKEIHSFTQVISALCIRPDAAVMAIGDESGVIQVMDTKQKFHLRTFKQHKKRVNAIEYIENDLYSGGDDFILRHFDVAAGDVVHSYQNAHSDYIKDIKIIQNNHILTAGYDGYVRLFDFRVHESAQMEFHHNEPLESIDIFPSKLTFIAGGGNKVALYDIRAGKQLFSAQNNKKMVSGVKYASNGSRFITTSFDHYLKVYKTDTFQLTYQDKYASPIHSFDLTHNEQHLFLGLEGGKLMDKRRNGKVNEDSDEQKQVQDEIVEWMKKNEQKKFAYNDQYFYRGVYQKASNFDIKFEQNQNRKVSKYDALLKKFQYKEALIMSLDKKNMMIYLSLVDQYVQRGCLDRTINALTEDEIEKLFKLLTPLIQNIKYAKPSLLILQKIVKMEGGKGLDVGLFQGVNKELRLIQSCVQLEGILELVQFNFQ